MAMYVLLSFDDDDDAKAFVEDQLAGHSFRTEVVEGIYKKPTQFCDRTDTIHGSHRVIGWTKGQKWGWWVCAICKKPSPVASKNVPNEVSGFNLLRRLFPPKNESDIDFDSGKDLSTLAGLPPSDI